MTAAGLENCVRLVIGIGRQYWQIDIAVDEVQEPFVLWLGKPVTDSKAESSVQTLQKATKFR